MRNYYRIVPGSRAIYIEECKAESFIGVDFGIYQDLSNDLPERWQDFNEKFRPIWLENNEGKTKVAAGLACGSFAHRAVDGFGVRFQGYAWGAGFSLNVF